MLKIRLLRVGRKHDPSYRVVVVDSRRGVKSSSYLDNLGSYDPRSDKINLDAEKAKSWIAKGAQVTEVVHNILITAGVTKGKKIDVVARKIEAEPAGAASEGGEPRPESPSGREEKVENPA